MRNYGIAFGDDTKHLRTAQNCLASDLKNVSINVCARNGSSIMLVFQKATFLVDNYI